MKLMKLIATKPHRYGTRHLVAGDEYEAPDRHATALVASRKARFSSGPPVAEVKMVEPPPVTMQEPQEDERPAPDRDQGRTEIEALRAQAQDLGIDIDRRWGAARLQYEIAREQRPR